MYMQRQCPGLFVMKVQHVHVDTYYPFEFVRAVEKANPTKDELLSDNCIVSLLGLPSSSLSPSSDSLSPQQGRRRSRPESVLSAQRPGAAGMGLFAIGGPPYTVSDRFSTLLMTVSIEELICWSSFKIGSLCGALT